MRYRYGFRGIDNLTVSERQVIARILSGYGIAGSLNNMYYDFARELEKGKPVGELHEKYLRYCCKKEILNRVAIILRKH